MRDTPHHRQHNFISVLRTIPLLAATCLVGFVLLQLLFKARSW